MGDEMTLEEMKHIKKVKGFTNAMISEISGIPASTLQKVFSGTTPHPRYKTLAAIEKALYEMGGVDSTTYPISYGYLRNHPIPDGKLSSTGMVRESAPVYSVKKDGDYTVDDYYALPEDVRVELIDGVFYDMAAPTGLHQRILGEIHRQIANFILDHDYPCIPYAGPRDVQLDCDNKTMLQPDVMVICEKERDQKQVIFGAPDFVVEIISPSTKRRDYIKKLSKYMEAGVREYWIVDPYRAVVTVYWFEEEDLVHLYPIDADIPVGISGGELVISFSRIAAWVKEGKI